MKKFKYIWYEPSFFYKDLRKKIKREVPLSKFNKYHREYGAFLRRELIKGRVMAIPHLGSLKIIGTKMYMGDDIDGSEHNFDTLYVDWAETYKLWEEHPELKTKQFIRHTNENSNNVIYRVIFAAYPKGCIWRLFKPKSNMLLGRAIKNAIKERKLQNIDVVDKRRLRVKPEKD